MPVPASTTPSHVAIRQSNPCAKRSKVSGPGVMKNTQIQIGQWLNRYESLLRVRIFRSDANSTRRAWPSSCS